MPHRPHPSASPRPPLAVDDEGNALLSFAYGTEDEPPSDAPLPLALTALWHGARVLLVHDRSRRCWELPGGGIEPGETPREAAVRELLEESGQRPDGPLRFLGYAAFALGLSGRAEYGALFTGRTAVPRAFRPNAEIAALHWWDLAEPLTERMQPIDAFLAALTRTDGCT